MSSGTITSNISISASSAVVDKITIEFDLHTETYTEEIPVDGGWGELGVCGYNDPAQYASNEFNNGLPKLGTISNLTGIGNMKIMSCTTTAAINYDTGQWGIAPITGCDIFSIIEKTVTKFIINGVENVSPQLKTGFDSAKNKIWCTVDKGLFEDNKNYHIIIELK